RRHLEARESCHGGGGYRSVGWDGSPRLGGLEPYSETKRRTVQVAEHSNNGDRGRSDWSRNDRREDNKSERRAGSHGGYRDSRSDRGRPGGADSGSRHSSSRRPMNTERRDGGDRREGGYQRRDGRGQGGYQGRGDRGQGGYRGRD